MSERKTLLHQLTETVKFYKERKTVGRMKTEHSIFIPSQLMINQAEDTEEFIKAARDINSTIAFRCPVAAESREGKFSGVEFVFQFSADTDFDGIIKELETRM